MSYGCMYRQARRQKTGTRARRPAAGATRWLMSQELSNSESLTVLAPSKALPKHFVLQTIRLTRGHLGLARDISKVNQLY